MKFLISLLLIILWCCLANNYENFHNYYLAQPTKCFSCEAQLPAHLKFMGGPTKCFSCEKEIAQRYGLKYSDLAQPTKCFSCEAQMGANPLRTNSPLRY